MSLNTDDYILHELYHSARRLPNAFPNTTDRHGFNIGVYWPHYLSKFAFSEKHWVFHPTGFEGIPEQGVPPPKYAFTVYYIKGPNNALIWYVGMDLPNDGEDFEDVAEAIEDAATRACRTAIDVQGYRRVYAITTFGIYAKCWVMDPQPLPGYHVLVPYFSYGEGGARDYVDAASDKALKIREALHNMKYDMPNQPY